MQELLAGVKPFAPPKYDWLLDGKFLENWRDGLHEKDLVVRRSALEQEIISASEEFLTEQNKNIHKENASIIRNILKAIYARSDGTKLYFRHYEK